ncbi:MAG: ribosome small subunit-dependent GTPase A [Candidatus Marinimicrobia bacterium]|nr:ribosome small subunit-dependent GTPase A [Candidatus Neomarinimicrobiota bacterium]
MAEVKLSDIGWNSFFEGSMEPYISMGFEPGRIAIENRDNYLVLSKYGELSGQVTGKLLYTAESGADLPKVGDWVAISVFPDEGKAMIHEVLPRQSSFSRKVPDRKTEEQIIAANLDTIFVVQSLNEDFNINRLERYLVMIREQNITPAVILNKSDLVENPGEFQRQIREIVPDIRVLPLSAKSGEGFNQLESILADGRTFAFVGSSGVGKSTIINRLAGEDLFLTQETREGDSKGRHTTTRRELVVIPGCGLLIDTPGMREFQLWSGSGGMDDVFSDILSYAEQCKFNDCTHVHETECAVLDALDNAEISESHYENYMKLQRELAHLETKLSQKAALDKKNHWKQIHKDWKQMKKNRRKF